MEKSNIIDTLLYPITFFQKLTSKISTLILGVLLVGLINVVDIILGLYNKTDQLKAIPPVWELSLVAVVLVLVLGVLDVFGFSIPLFEMVKHIKKDSLGYFNQYNLIRMMKVYICAHFVVKPISFVITLYTDFLNPQENISLAFVAMYLFLAIMFWFSGIISRGVITLFGIEGRQRLGIIMVVFSWQFFFSLTFTALINTFLIYYLKIA